MPDEVKPQLNRPADEPMDCDVCHKKMPAIREGAIECHHDGTYTPLTPPSTMADLEDWKSVGQKLLDAFDGGQFNEAHIRDDLREVRILLGHEKRTPPAAETSPSVEAPSK